MSRQRPAPIPLIPPKAPDLTYISPRTYKIVGDELQTVDVSDKDCVYFFTQSVDAGVQAYLYPESATRGTSYLLSHRVKERLPNQPHCHFDIFDEQTLVVPSEVYGNMKDAVVSAPSSTPVKIVAGLGVLVAIVHAGLKRLHSVPMIKVESARQNVVETGSVSRERLDITEDKNVLAYDEARSHLEAEYPNEFVAYVDGNLVGHHSNRQTLIASVLRAFPSSEVFIQPVGNTQRLKLRRPKRVLG